MYHGISKTNAILYILYPYKFSCKQVDVPEHVLYFFPVRLIVHCLTHCILNRLSHMIYWKSPIWVLGTLGYESYIFLEKKDFTICKQWRPWSDAAFCSVWSGSALFATRGLPVTLLWVSWLQWVKQQHNKTHENDKKKKARQMLYYTCIHIFSCKQVVLPEHVLCFFPCKIDCSLSKQ